MIPTREQADKIIAHAKLSQLSKKARELGTEIFAVQKEMDFIQRVTGIHDDPFLPTAILMSSGNYFNFLAPDLYDYRIEEVARSLAREQRYSNQTRHTYSVAQHSVYVAETVPYKGDHLDALMHDCGEFVTGDLSTPFKRLLPQAKFIEEEIKAAIYRQLKIPQTHIGSVPEADLAMLATEKAYFFPDSCDWSILEGVIPSPVTIEPMTEEQAFIAFMEVYEKHQGVEQWR